MKVLVPQKVSGGGKSIWPTFVKQYMVPVFRNQGTDARVNECVSECRKILNFEKRQYDLEPGRGSHETVTSFSHYY